jgi:hypothetical protein
MKIEFEQDKVSTCHSSSISIFTLSFSLSLGCGYEIWQEPMGSNCFTFGTKIGETMQSSLERVA